MTDLGGLVPWLSQIKQQLAQIQQMLDLPALLQRMVASNRDSVLGLLNGYLLDTADVSSPGALLPFVQVKAVATVEPYAQAAADAALVAVAVWSFYRLMWTHSVGNRYAVQLMLPRFLLAVVLINFARPLFQAAVDVNNALCDAVRQLGVAWDWSSALDFGNGLNSFGATLVVYAAIFLGYAVLGFAYVVRYALLVVLAITAPLAALMFVLPETHKYARDWAALFVATLFMQPLQLLVLAVGFMLDAGGSFPIRHLFALATIYIAFKVPGALHSSSSAGSHATSAAKRYAGRAMKAVAKA